MDTSRLKRFATEARNILIQGVRNRLQALGFDLKTGQPSELPQEMEGGAVFMNDVVSLDFYKRWMSLFHNIQSRSIREVTEEAAYTWFNRFMAIRIMEKQGFIAPVLEYESEDIHVPAIVSDAQQGRFPDMRETERQKLMGLLEDPSKVEQQFALLIVAYCHANPIVNQCFGTIADYTELLLPPNILSDAGFLTMLNHTEFISDEQYASAELIGWLYQFYISDRKDEAFAKKGKYDPDEIAPATQIFTPNWIVKYMVQNTIGRIYLDNNPYEDELQEKWRYLVEPMEQREQSQVNLNFAESRERSTISQPTEKTPEDGIFHYDDLRELKAADLACGSGHILNEAFDMFYDLYINEGYNRKDAIVHIFRYNLLGIDIDSRAKQLATFALLMKACQKDASFLDGHLMPRVYAMPRPIGEVMPDDLTLTLEDEDAVRAWLETIVPKFLMGDNRKIVGELCDAIQLMDDAGTLGSIMKFNLSESTRNIVLIRVQEYEELMTQGGIVTEEFRLLMPYMRIILALTDHYAAICMNPPYMGSGRFDNVLSKYVKDNYEKSKADLFAVFMEVAIDRLADKGKYGMINMHSWMFLSSFEKLRHNLLENYHIDSLLHLGPRTFDELSGEVVQNSAFVVNKTKAHCCGTYYRLIDGRCCGDKEHLFLESLKSHIVGVCYAKVIQENFERIPGCPIGYWVSEKVVKLFDNRTIDDYFVTGHGILTGHDEDMIRFWHEIQHNLFSADFKSADELHSTNKVYVPLAKGGNFRRWYGNRILVIKYDKTTISYMQRFPKFTLQNEDYYFKEGASWAFELYAGTLSLRFMPRGSVFSHRGPAVFAKEGSNIYYAIAFLSSKTCGYFLNILNPTISCSAGVVKIIPAINIDKIDIDIVKQNIEISRIDWDCHETSWDFETNPLVSLCNKGIESSQLKELVEMFKANWTEHFNKLHHNEEELNRQFIEIYGLQNELTPEVPMDEITILQQGEISIKDNQIVWHTDVLMKQLISYAVGCMKGRYSIDKPGLILANQGDGIEQFNELVPNSRFEVDDDGIVPLMSAQSDFADNATLRFKHWLSVTFGEDTLVENLNFIEAALGKSIDDYFVKDFWKDHKKMYQNRPIYWLFSSKKGAFQCIAYMHRMDAYTAERIRTKYLLPHIEWLLQKQSEMEAEAVNLSARERKQLDNIVKQIAECREYHDRLHFIADKQIAFDLDDGVVVNYAKFGDVLAKIK